MTQSLDIYSLVISILLTLTVNKILEAIIYKLTREEKHLTKTNETISLLIKLVLSQFINTALLNYYLALTIDTTFTSNIGLVIQITTLIVASSAWKIVKSLCPPAHIFRKLKLYFKYRKLSGENDDHVDNFQIELNKEY